MNMNHLNRRTAASAAMLLLGSAILALTSWPAPAPAAAAHRSGVPPYCVLRHTARGFALPQLCVFYDYQQCLEAAAGWYGNCVLNIDYHGKLVRPPGANWSPPPDWR